MLFCIEFKNENVIDFRIMPNPRIDSEKEEKYCAVNNFEYFSLKLDQRVFQAPGALIFVKDSFD